jgi:hypothetical protein
MLSEEEESENESLSDNSQGSEKIPQEKASVNLEKDEDDFQTTQDSRIVSIVRKYRLISVE